MGDDRKRRQDTFVVRLWRDVQSLRLLRAEVEHVQSGDLTEHHWRASNPDIGPDWILDQMLSADRLQPGERSAPGANQPNEFPEIDPEPHGTETT